MSAFDIAKKYLSSEKAEPSHSADDLPRDPDWIGSFFDGDELIAVLIDSKVLGAKIWFAFRDGWQPEGTYQPYERGKPACKTAIFYASELPTLRGETPEQLRWIFNVKCAFGGGRVTQ